jgi:hypothetical protein
MPKKAEAKIRAKVKAKPKAQAVPRLPHHTATPYLFAQGAARAIDFFKAAFKARELSGCGSRILKQEGRVVGRGGRLVEVDATRMRTGSLVLVSPSGCESTRLEKD